MPFAISASFDLAVILVYFDHADYKKAVVVTNVII